eukprot:4198452-Prymnesium_polylepis.1
MVHLGPVLHLVQRQHLVEAARDDDVAARGQCDRTHAPVAPQLANRAAGQDRVDRHIVVRRDGDVRAVGRERDAAVVRRLVQIEERRARAQRLGALLRRRAVEPWARQALHAAVE